MSKQRKRVKRLALDTKLSRDDTKAIASMALIETLIIDMQSYSGPDRGRILKGMMNLLNGLNKTYVGSVDDEFIAYADRYLCRVQSAMDGFFDDLTEADREDMERIKAEWKVGMEEAA